MLSIDCDYKSMIISNFDSLSSQCMVGNEKTKVTVERECQSKSGNKASPDGWTLVTGHKTRDKVIEPFSLGKERKTCKMDELSDFRCDIFHNLPQGSDYRNEDKRGMLNDSFSAPICGSSTSFTQTSPVSSRVSNIPSDLATVASASSIYESLAPGNQSTSVNNAEGIPALMSLELEVPQTSNTNHTFGNNRYAPLATSQVPHFVETQTRINVDEQDPVSVPSIRGFMQPPSTACGSGNVLDAPLSTSLVPSIAAPVNRDENAHTRLPLSHGLVLPVETTLAELGVAATTMTPNVTNSSSNTTDSLDSKTALDTSSSEHIVASSTPLHDGVATNTLAPSAAYTLQNLLSQSVSCASFPPGFPQPNGFPGLFPVQLLSGPLPPQPVGGEERREDGVQSSQSSQDVKRFASLQQQLCPETPPEKDVLRRFISGCDSSNLPENNKTRAQCARLPPGLGIRVDREPVVETAPKPVRESKYSSFDKLMDALKKKFPTLSK